MKHFDGSDVLLDHCLEDVGMLVQSIFELELNLSDNMKALLELGNRILKLTQEYGSFSFTKQWEFDFPWPKILTKL